MLLRNQIICLTTVVGKVWGYAYFWVYYWLVNGVEADNMELVENFLVENLLILKFSNCSCLVIEKAFSTCHLALVYLTIEVFRLIFHSWLQKPPGTHKILMYKFIINKITRLNLWIIKY